MDSLYNVSMLTHRLTRLVRAIRVFVVVAPTIVLAQIPTIVPENCRAGAAQNCGVCDIAQLAQNVINAGIYIAVFLSAVLFAWAGFNYLIAGGDSGKAEHAKKVFWNIGAGLVLILAAWLIVDLIMKMLVNQDALFGPWNEVC